MKSILRSLILVLALILSACTPKTAFKGECTLVYSEGSVTMDGKPIEIGAIITDGALLQTSSDGLAEFVFNQKNIVKMGPNTRMRLEVATLQRVVHVEQGTFTAVLRKLDRLGGGKLEVRTPTAVAGVRGTSFFARFEPDKKETYFCTCNGTLSLSLTDGSGATEKTANHHLTTIYSGDVGNVVIIPPPADFDFGHSDKDLEDLAARIGETMDWTKAE